MLITQLNAFLATAIGGFIFTLLAGIIKHLYSWLNSVKKGEEFLVEELDLNPALIRLSVSNNKRNTKIYSPLEKTIFFGLGTLLIAIAIGIVWLSFSIFTNDNLYQVKEDYAKTHDTFIIRSGLAKNTGNNKEWEITLETCNHPDLLDKVNSIKGETKGYICQILSDENKDGALPLRLTKIIWANIAFATVLLLSGLWMLFFGSGALIDVYINKKIAQFNKKEIEKSYQYLT